jgi:hypothetical protein
MGLSSAALFLLRGISGFTVSWVLLIIGISLIKKQNRITFVSLTVAGISLITGDANAGTALILTGALFGIAGSDLLLSRVAFFVSFSVIMIEGSITGLLPLFIVSFPVLLFKSGKLRFLSLAGGILTGLLICGLPMASTYRIMTNDEILCKNTVIWPDPLYANLNHPVLLLEAENMDSTELFIEISAGGVRDPSVMGVIETGGQTQQILPGSNIFIFREAASPVVIKLTRKWQPFNHPVIWVQEAWTVSQSQ